MISIWNRGPCRWIGIQNSSHNPHCVRFDIVTLFPEMFSALTESGVTARALKQGYYQIGLHNPRDFTQDRHRTVDDRPYGGGPGMVMMPAPLQAAIQQAKQQVVHSECGTKPAKVIYLSPQGRPLNQGLVTELLNESHLILVAGRYEGVDERLIRQEVDLELSIGDYVLSGGELGVMVVMDAVIRQIPGVLGHADSAEQDSFRHGLLDCPHYTRPECHQGALVPAVLLSGDHAAIAEWRLMQSLGRTEERRPDLLAQYELTRKEQQLLEIYRENSE